ncbi:ABC-type nitrate/sulfonate/bicarbonate transport system, permease component [Desulfosporosinus orientis DSM 765]|uniref:ABC-type nitrate/sulfonate/bicarbonate transport system, permease component n=1 Tax=Desulfosporosinus orientis (strain ATCC 19365 / DSM 765 / NCIMB 8382 / VKM B-1628 / Singapore I) TaxID=768706 RepID=G7WB86_DESOD|nr:ABC transporter permease [Desulfosporosinus orientis]AET67867.1 ABC-type nitrate/sulfonate/bicarbonate transport system, permease component [Desulfosporosinus orientis DSM 765]
MKASRFWQGKFFGYLGATVFLLALWQYAAWSLNSPLLPTPKAAITATIRLLDGNLGRHLWVSTYRVVISTVTALLIGLPLGLVMGYEKRIDGFLAPLVYITYPIPKIVFLPLILLLLGLGDVSKIFLITFIVFFQILVTTRDAVRKVPAETISSLRSLGGSRAQIYRYVLLPASLPDVFTSLRLSMGTAIAVLFFAESFATTEGLGYFIMDSWSRAAPDEMFAGIIMMALLGVGLFMVVDFFDNILCRWQHMNGNRK